MPAEFLDDLAFHIENPQTEVVVLDALLRYRSADGRLFTIPAGFRNDLASVPNALRSIAPPWSQSARSGVMHDCGYRWYEVWAVEKPDLDRLFYEGLRSDGTGRIRARLMTWTVQVFGGPAWRRWRSTPAADKGVVPPPVQT